MKHEMICNRALNKKPIKFNTQIIATKTYTQYKISLHYFQSSSLYNFNDFNKLQDTTFCKKEP